MKELQERISVLQKELLPLMAEKGRLEEEKLKVENQKFVGKSWVYKNNRGGGAEKWDVYYRVFWADEFFIHVIKVEFPYNGLVKVETEKYSFRFIKDCLKPLPNKMFDKKFAEAIKKLEEIKNGLEV